MKSFLAVLICWLSFGFSLTASVTSQNAFTYTGVGPIWSDEFNGTTLDPTKWAIVTKAGAIVYYTARPQNVSVSGGNLNLVALHDNYSTGGMTYAYTSGYVWTNGLQTWTNGTFEIRAKFINGQGMHPTFWFLNASDTFSMMESDAGAANNSFFAGQDPCPTVCPPYTLPSGNLSTFHVWRMVWDTTTQPATFRNYFDGVLWSTQHHDTSSGAYYLILNLAAVTYTGGIDPTTPFPNTFNIDYVRVYANGTAP